MTHLYLTCILRLTLLAPGTVEAIIYGQQRGDPTDAIETIPWGVGQAASGPRLPSHCRLVAERVN